MARDTKGDREGARASKGAARASRASARARDVKGHSALGERYIAGRPARIMRPRLVFAACLAAILAFGLLMVYSASSVEALKTYGDSLYFFKRQLMWILVGLVLFAVAAKIPLGVWRTGVIWVAWGIILVMLLAVLVAGQGSRGATRWIPIGPLTLQPSEFAKAVIILLAARVFSAHYEEGRTDTAQFLCQLGLCVGVPLVLIIIQPDFGTCAIILATVYIMCFMAGFSYPLLFAVLAVVAAVGLIFIVAEPYRLARLTLDPWSDPFGDGFQATIAMMAFASGGLFGRGIGNSTMKYNYLPEAHNDYILAIIGEEVGFVGTVAFFAVFFALVCAGMKIAMRSPTLQGKLVASGCSCILMIQFFVNVLGILSVIPMTGKTLPFISYGGSSMWASLILAGLVMRVSIESEVETEHDRRRSSLEVVDEDAATPRPRSSRAAFSVYDGGASPAPRGRASSQRAFDRASRPTGTRDRIDLGPSARSRLRGEETRNDTRRGTGRGPRPRPRRDGR